MCCRFLRSCCCPFFLVITNGKLLSGEIALGPKQKCTWDVFVRCYLHTNNEACYFLLRCHARLLQIGHSTLLAQLHPGSFALHSDHSRSDPSCINLACLHFYCFYSREIHSVVWELSAALATLPVSIQMPSNGYFVLPLSYHQESTQLLWVSTWIDFPAWILNVNRQNDD